MDKHEISGGQKSQGETWMLNIDNVVLCIKYYKIKHNELTYTEEKKVLPGAVR